MLRILLPRREARLGVPSWARAGGTPLAYPHHLQVSLGMLSFREGLPEPRLPPVPSSDTALRYQSQRRLTSRERPPVTSLTSVAYNAILRTAKITADASIDTLINRWTPVRPYLTWPVLSDYPGCGSDTVHCRLVGPVRIVERGLRIEPRSLHVLTFSAAFCASWA